LCNFQEKEAAAGLFRTRAILTGNMMGLKTKEDMVQKTFELFREYAQIVLPNATQNVKIEDIDKDKLMRLKDTLKKARRSIPK